MTVYIRSPVYRTNVYHTSEECHNYVKMDSMREVSEQKAKTEYGLVECSTCAGVYPEAKSQYNRGLRHKIQKGEIPTLDGAYRCPSCDGRDLYRGKENGQDTYKCDDPDCEFYHAPLARSKDELHRVYAELSPQEGMILADD